MAKTRLLSIAIGGRRAGGFAGKEEATTVPSTEAKRYVGFTRSVGKLINN